MGNNMNNGIILTVNLVGATGNPITKTEAVKFRNADVVLLKNITYRGKEEQKCVRKTNISEEVIRGWVGNKSPYFCNDFVWKKMSKTQRLKAWVERFDEGFGVSFQEL